MIINYETVGRSDEQLKAQYAADPKKLSADELLYTATLENDIAKRKAIYAKTAEIYPNDYRAKNNIGVMEMMSGRELEAIDNFQEAMERAKLPEAYANMAMIVLQHGDIDMAERYLANATGATGMAKVLGALNIAKGNYMLAEQNLKGDNNNLALLSQIVHQPERRSDAVPIGTDVRGEDDGLRVSDDSRRFLQCDLHSFSSFSPTGFSS